MGSEIHARMLGSGEREEFHCSGSQDGSRKSSCATQELGCIGRKNSSMSISGNREVLNRSLNNNGLWNRHRETAAAEAQKKSSCQKYLENYFLSSFH